MRFNLLGPEPPKASALMQLITFQHVPIGMWTALISLAIIAGGVAFRVIPSAIVGAHLASLQAAVKQEQFEAASGIQMRADLAAYRDAASHFAEVRESGQTTAASLVRVANLWPNPARIPAALRCYTPSEDGQSVTLTGIASNYEAYAQTVESIRQRYLVVPSEDPKGNHFELTLKVRT